MEGFNVETNQRTSSMPWSVVRWNFLAKKIKEETKYEKIEEFLEFCETKFRYGSDRDENFSVSLKKVENLMKEKCWKLEFSNEFLFSLAVFDIVMESNEARQKVENFVQINSKVFRARTLIEGVNF